MANRKAYQAAYQKRRYAERREEAVRVLGGKCVKCGGVEDLQLDHVDPAAKSMHFQQMVMASRPRFLAELAKCQLLCFPCHCEKSSKEGDVSLPGTRNGRARLTVADVVRIRQLYADGMTMPTLGEQFGVPKQHIFNIVHRKRWKHVP